LRILRKIIDTTSELLIGRISFLKEMSRWGQGRVF